MSDTTELTIFKDQNVGFTRGVAIDFVKEDLLQEGVFIAAPTLKAKQGKFILSVAGKLTEMQELEVVIIAVRKISKKYYEKIYNSNQEPTAPDCYSLDGEVPVNNCAKRQCKSCAQCPKNAWGSDTKSGNGGKACKDFRRIIVAPRNELDNLVILDLPTMSIKSAAQYSDFLSKHKINMLYNGVSTSRSVTPFDVVTKLSLDKTKDFPLIKFDAIDYLTDEEAMQVCTLQNSKKVSELLNTDIEVSESNAKESADIVTWTPMDIPTNNSPHVCLADDYDDMDIPEPRVIKGTPTSEKLGAVAARIAKIK